VVVLSVSVVFVAVEERPELAPASIRKIALNQSAAPPAEAAPPVPTRIVESSPRTGIAADTVKKNTTAEADAGAMDTSAPRARQKDAALLKEERGSASLAPSMVPSLAAPPPQTAAAPAPPTPVHSPPAQSAAAPVPAPAPTVANLAPAPFPATAADAVAPARKEARSDARSDALYAAAPEAKAVKEKAAIAGALHSLDAMNAPEKPAAPAATSSPAMPAAAVSVAPAPTMKLLAPAASAPQASGAAARAGTQAAKSSVSAGIRSFSNEPYPISGKGDADERPGPWLKRLLELREQGRHKELREELVRFKKAHPDVVLPRTLTELPVD
jgi:hypothetical protein